MENLSEQDITGRVVSNVYYDTFAEVEQLYKDKYNIQCWEKASTIVIVDTDADAGSFDKSDIIIVYNRETGLPSIVTERLYKKNYTARKWRAIKRMLRLKVKLCKEEFGYSLRLSLNMNSLDFIHYKEEWWQWALENKQ